MSTFSQTIAVHFTWDDSPILIRMKRSLTIGLVGDVSDSVLAHRAIPLALQLAAASSRREVHFEWLATDAITSTDPLHRYDGLWCVPGSPYRNMAGALLAIGYARCGSVPFLGTCGGFQHAVIEYARNVLGWSDAEHAETAPEAERAVIAPLACSLVEVKDTIRFKPDSRLARAYDAAMASEGYHCRYGLNPELADALLRGPLVATAHDDAGEVRAIELDTHPFFVATLFQPERAALAGKVPPLVASFIQACEA